MSEENLVEAFVRGFSKPLVLWLIFLRPMHGYDLMLEFKNITGRRLKPGVVYPFLHSLEEGGYVVGMWVANGKRRVKSYRLTAKGEALLTSVKRRVTVPLGDIVLELIRRRDR